MSALSQRTTAESGPGKDSQSSYNVVETIYEKKLFENVTK